MPLYNKVEKSRRLTTSTYTLDGSEFATGTSRSDGRRSRTVVFVFTISLYFMHFINLSGYLAASVQIKPVDQLDRSRELLEREDWGHIGSHHRLDLC